MDDDDFDYDEDYSYSDAALDEDEDDMRAELEFDEIKSQLSRNPQAAIPRLEKLAQNYSTVQSLTAALDLMKCVPNQSNFQLVILAIAKGPARLDDYAKMGPLEQSWSLLWQHDQTDLVDLYKRAIEDIKSYSSPRVYLKSMIMLAAYYIHKDQYCEAYLLLRQQISPGIAAQSSNIWALALKIEFFVHEVDILMAVQPFDFERFHECITEIDQLPSGAALPLQKLFFSEAKARYLVETHELDEAKSIFEAIVRGYEDTITRQSSQESLIRSAIFLTLISTIQDYMPFDLSRSYPKLHSLHSSGLDAALKFSKSYHNLSSENVDQSLDNLQCWIQSCKWKLGAETLMRQLKSSYTEWHTMNLLKSYSRIRISKLTSITNITKDDLQYLLLSGRLDANYKINAVDQTIDLANTTDWRRPTKDFKANIKLPRRYSAWESKRSQIISEAAIMNKPKLEALGSGSHKSVDNSELATISLLKETLIHHRDSMMN